MHKKYDIIKYIKEKFYCREIILLNLKLMGQFKHALKNISVIAFKIAYHYKNLIKIYF